jgi:hypothetical protein
VELLLEVLVGMLILVRNSSGNSMKNLKILLDNLEYLTNIVPLLKLRVEVDQQVEKESVLLAPLQGQDTHLPLLRMMVELTMIGKLAKKTMILLR